ncbi:DUF3047 domain-containing protein [Paucibacter sp. APW11]|uniref:DUF3047 domain-containing protein n=1 Tax=Roseateles aquae TaxID=3077235 RepID=A0ABU3PHW8_9BURK|nr:DUF3047 domain-containing protein [Paucibacter sp. APW11]MDT9002160.1 DUF3047 domain-containing protein [Paucibacter sp. APW11]
MFELRPIHFFALLAVFGVLQACSVAPTRHETSPSAALNGVLQDWSPRELPGKAPTRYSLSERAGRPCVLAQADASASLLRRPMHVQRERLSAVEFHWWIERFEAGSHRPTEGADDAAARLVLAFDGDDSSLSLRNRMMFELARAVTGEAPPYATLMYVWDMRAAPGTLIINAHTDRVRQIVMGSGRPDKPGWQHFRRDVAADFRLAFGEAPGTLIGMALMTDADNIRGRAQACYGDVLFLDAAAEAQSLAGSLRF